MRDLIRPDDALKQSLSRSHSVGAVSRRLRLAATRCVPVCIFFAIAFTVDQATQQRYSAILGSAAIAGSVLSVFPALRPATRALGSYGAIWLAFNLVRAVADDAGLAIGSQAVASSFEAMLFGRTLPSQWLQDRFYDPARIQVHDIVLALVHASFFVTPFIVGVVLWARRRAVFYRYCGATAIAFGLGLVGFVLLPTAPPWLSEPESVTRVTIHALSMGDGGSAGSLGVPTTEDSRLGFEPNHVAALPSVHVAAAVLVYLAMRRTPWHLPLLGAAYALAMTLAVVYLGEHFLIDALLGWAIALAGWRIAKRFVPRMAHD